MKIHISTVIGLDIRTRSFFRRDIESLMPTNGTETILDFSNVVFISRSVADEIYNVVCDYPNTLIEGMTGDVNKMYNVVCNSRRNPRVYSSTGNIKVIQLNSLDDMERILSVP